MREGKSNPLTAWLFSNFYLLTFLLPPSLTPNLQTRQFGFYFYFFKFFLCGNIPFKMWIISYLANSQLPLWQHLAGRDSDVRAGRDVAFLVGSFAFSASTCQTSEALYLGSRGYADFWGRARRWHFESHCEHADCGLNECLCWDVFLSWDLRMFRLNRAGESNGGKSGQLYQNNNDKRIFRIKNRKRPRGCTVVLVSPRGTDGIQAPMCPVSDVCLPQTLSCGLLCAAVT